MVREQVDNRGSWIGQPCSGWLGGPLLIALACLLLVVTLPAQGQDRFQLDDDTYEWEQQTRYDPASPEGELQAIRRLLAQDQARQAQRQAEQWIERYPNHPQLPEAYLLAGDAKSDRGRYYEALFDYEHLIRRFPASEHYQTALEREFEIANRFAAGTRRHLLGLRIVNTNPEAEELFILIQERAPGSDLGERASLNLADFYFDRNRMDEAADAYDLFLINYPRSTHRERAMLRLIHANLATFKGPRFDPTGLIDARERLIVYRREFPAAAEAMGVEGYLRNIDEALATKSFSNARWYERTDRRVSAAFLYRRVIRDYPHTAAAEAAIARLDRMGEPVVDPHGLVTHDEDDAAPDDLP